MAAAATSHYSSPIEIMARNTATNADTRAAQFARHIDAAKKAGADESGGKFERAFTTIVKQKPRPKPKPAK
jgi:hypothetical protein